MNRTNSSRAKSLAALHKRRREGTEKELEEALQRLIQGVPKYGGLEISIRSLCVEARKSPATYHRYPRIKLALKEAQKNKNQIVRKDLHELTHAKQNLKAARRQVRKLEDEIARLSSELYLMHAIIQRYASRSESARQKFKDKLRVFVNE